MNLGVTAYAATLLRDARERIATPEQWTQGVLWRDVAAGPTCYCLDGALLDAVSTVDLMNSGASLCLSMTARSHGFETASKFNDAPGRTHAEVLALLDEAIALAVSLAEVPSGRTVDEVELPGAMLAEAMASRYEHPHVARALMSGDDRAIEAALRDVAEGTVPP